MTFGTLALVCAVAGAFVFVLSGLAARGRWLADPVSVRSNHSVPTSRAGGVLILLALGGVVTVTAVSGGPTAPAAALMALAAGVIGLFDDVFGVAAGIKFAALAILSSFVAFLVGPVAEIPLPGGEGFALPPAAGYATAGVFVFGFVNAFNFMDGLNGMAGAAGVVGLSGLILLSGTARPDLLVTCLVVAALLYGFTIRNVLTGRIFLGDAGSLSVGTLLSASALELSADRPAPLYVFAIGFLPFVCDTVFTLVRRAMRGENVFEAHKDHFYQRLRGAGWSHEAVAAMYAALITFCWAVALGLSRSFGADGLWFAFGVGALTTVTLLLGLDRFVVRKAAPRS